MIVVLAKGNISRVLELLVSHVVTLNLRETLIIIHVEASSSCIAPIKHLTVMVLLVGRRT